MSGRQHPGAGTLVPAMASARRRVLGVVAVVAAAVFVSAGAVRAQPDDTSGDGATDAETGETGSDDAARAVAEIVAARERANNAAEAYLAAESRLELLRLGQDQILFEIRELEQRVAELKRHVEQVAINRFVASGASGIPILTDFREPTAQLQAGVLAEVVADAGATTVDDYEAAQLALREKRVELRDSQREVEQSQRELLALQAEAEDEVVRLREVESRRLEDEAVQAALAAQQREELRQIQEMERRQAEARREADRQPTASVGAAIGATSQGDTSGRTGFSGGDVGGRTGGGGIGNNPRLGGDNYIDMILCPIQGGSAYGDSWGAPRSGGRRHQGVDMLAPAGTLLQAVVSGTIVQRSNPLGGITIGLFGDNGNRYYYAHLLGYEGEPRYVLPGEVIGYVGDTGNATGTPHLHFEIRPGGGVPVNPYPSVRAAGC